MTVLKSFDFAAARSNTRMPWDVYTDGKIRQLKRGTDFTQKYFAAQIKQYARIKGFTVKVSGGNPGDDQCTFQFVTATGKAKKAPKAKKTTESPLTAIVADATAELTK